MCTSSSHIYMLYNWQSTPFFYYLFSFFCLFSIHKCPDNLSLLAWCCPSPFSLGLRLDLHTNFLQRWFKQSDHNPSSLCFGCVHIFTLMWVRIVGLKSDHLEMHLNRKGLRGGSSTLDNKVKVITVAAAANKSHIITKQANRLREALRRFGLFVRLMDLFLCLSHVTQIAFFFSAPCDVFFQLGLEYSEWSNQA